MAQTKPKRKRENLGGRPRKFQEASRPVTLTLPERTLALLASVDSDRARAIAKATDWVTQAKENTSPVEILEVEDGRALIVVGPSRLLRELPWLKLVEIAPSRFLLVIPTGTPLEKLEVAVLDMIESTEKIDSYEKKLLQELGRCLTLHRRGKKVSTAELLFLDTST